MLYEEPKMIALRAASERGSPLPTLRQMPLDDFGLLLLDTSPYPELAPVLPTMPPDAVQSKWTGRAGGSLLTQSVAFMRAIETLHARFRNRSMFGRTFLDYGCGWGRLLRLALYYSDPDKLYGVDAWEESLSVCREYRAPGTLELIDAAPDRISVDASVDIAYAFSIFTHLPDALFRSALRAVRGCVAPDGLFVFTIRPVEYWDHHQEFPLKSRDALVTEHRNVGFAYQSHHRSDELYGDASMSNAFADAALESCGWRRLAFDRMLVDPVQVIVVAEPVGP